MIKNILLFISSFATEDAHLQNKPTSLITDDVLPAVLIRDYAFAVAESLKH